MSARYGSRAVNAQAAAIAKLLDGGFLDLMTGEQPEDADEPVSDDLRLARCSFSPIAFGAPRDGVLQANEIIKTVAIRNGEPTWCRCVAKDGTAIVDGSVGKTGANVITKVAMIVEGQIVNITAFKHTVSKQGI